MLGPTVNLESLEGYPTVSRDLTFYFFSNRGDDSGDRDIYRAAYVNGVYEQAERLKEPVNTEDRDSNTYISPDESYIIFNSRRDAGYGSADLYISYNKSGRWTEPENLGPRINTDAYEFCPVVSPDGSKLFFSRSKEGVRNIYHIDLRETIIRAKRS